MRNVSDVPEAATLPISQNRCPNRFAGFRLGVSFSMRRVARPLKGDVLLTVGVVE